MNFTQNYGTDLNYIGTQLKLVTFLDTMSLGEGTQSRVVDGNILNTDISTPKVSMWPRTKLQGQYHYCH
jgi:hypothetical protein